MKKILNNFCTRLISSFIIDRTKRKAFRQRYLIDKRANLYPIIMEGKNNKVIVCKNGKEQVLKKGDMLYGVNITISGDNNTIRLRYPINFNSTNLKVLGSNNTYIEINPSPYVDGLNLSMSFGDSQKCIIGEGTTSCGLKIDLPSNSSCIIGKDCMFAEFVKLWCGDCHVITDKETGEIINPDPIALQIGNHCWVGESARLLKHTFLPDNTIIGAYSVVTKSFEEENLIIAGNPAKIIRKNAVWHRDNQCTMLL